MDRDQKKFSKREREHRDEVCRRAMERERQHHTREEQMLGEKDLSGILVRVGRVFDFERRRMRSPVPTLREVPVVPPQLETMKPAAKSKSNRHDQEILPKREQDQERATSSGQKPSGITREGTPSAGRNPTGIKREETPSAGQNPSGIKREEFKIKREDIKIKLEETTPSADTNSRNGVPAEKPRGGGYLLHVHLAVERKPMRPDQRIDTGRFQLALKVSNYDQNTKKRGATVFSTTKPLCQFIKEDEDTYPQLREVSNLPEQERCPFPKGKYQIDNYKVETNFLPDGSPKGDYKLQLSLLDREIPVSGLEVIVTLT
ncbi:hypothetical protein KR084_009642 [Drosophila pseudotakahashii]|nr:hypothetical protein KR084_009642 [Drosophila pseudotakahashii]